MNTDRFVWQNTPWTLITLGTGLVEGIVIGFLSTRILNTVQVSDMTWIVVISLIQLVSVMLATYLLRQFKAIGMFALLIIVAIYLFFTPSLGVQVLAGTLTKTITAISPFSWIESCITQLTGGTNLGWPSYLYLSGAAVVGVVINLLVYRRNKGRKDGAANEAEIAK